VQCDEARWEQKLFIAKQHKSEATAQLGSVSRSFDQVNLRPQKSNGYMTAAVVWKKHFVLTCVVSSAVLRLGRAISSTCRDCIFPADVHRSVTRRTETSLPMQHATAFEWSVTHAAECVRG